MFEEVKIIKQGGPKIISRNNMCDKRHLSRFLKNSREDQNEKKYQIGGSDLEKKQKKTAQSVVMGVGHVNIRKSLLCRAWFIYQEQIYASGE